MRQDFLLKDRPTLTCMVQGKTPRRILELIQRGIKEGADAFGIQLEQLEQQYQTEDVYRALFAAMQERPAYVTCYRHGENQGKSDEALCEQIYSAASCGGALMDVVGDFFDPTPMQITYKKEAVVKQREVIKTIHTLGAQVLMSSHVMTYQPFEQVYKLALSQHARGADIAKIVTSAETEQELRENLSTSAKLAAYMDKTFLFLCGGDQNRLHRRIAPLLSCGMYLCVVEHDELATPAQPLLRDAKAIVEAVIGD